MCTVRNSVTAGGITKGPPCVHAPITGLLSVTGQLHVTARLSCCVCYCYYGTWDHQVVSIHRTTAQATVGNWPCLLHTDLAGRCLQPRIMLTLQARIVLTIRLSGWHVERSWQDPRVISACCFEAACSAPSSRPRQIACRQHSL